MSNGVADSLRDSLRGEALRRNNLARDILKDRPLLTDDSAFHLWWPMPHARAEVLAASALERGVSVTAPNAVRTDPEDDESGIRLCLGGPSRAEVERGLSVLAQLTSDG
ncbi:hypothetical protein [Salipiger thiooxidans]|uniref:hypothetical protein n=1 Tax=Salipiger thiooxidans TaxID=282683 RepID=UPI001CF97E07|nr:hypothetical protein [Salipiger thiooxidans]